MRIAIFYATREGQTRRIAAHIADELEARELDCDLIDVGDPPAQLALSTYRAAILAASVHVGRYEREMLKFVKAHRDELARIPTAFLSVSMAEAGVEDRKASPEQRARDGAELELITRAFLVKTGFKPDQVVQVAGALRYTQYNFLVRFIMKRIARAHGASTDTSRDHELTDWQALDRFVDGFVDRLVAQLNDTEGCSVRA
jgi:menaquinone-dependent protoporphyrinogen oxidase